MAELTRLGRVDGSAVWPQVRYAAAVNSTLDHIRLYLYGLDDAPDTRHTPTERDRDAFDEITTVATAHNWTNPHNPADHRFRLHTHVVTPGQVSDLHELGRTPATVTVVADPNPFWT
ncbi:hypothetical protein [Amycolatopsis sp. H20-H5]|uniref:hypothetical protein n=1 Tax=Amycolatopsis sp. H20-H5 TaxID=3046309 RepID=UPI002DB98B8D|nr:hypothetical protein [Amycolatopsis sp. H20-H5]MEC3979918.1 hypothetical protein [Amycolatopsis sp. H20-H5]